MAGKLSCFRNGLEMNMNQTFIYIFTVTEFIRATAKK